ncbi:hypothetical protein F6R98_10340 [Candidatus Methylospira mobilis]|uniref:Uncharacterized protein n=1 Tax=Candidatus Methylospira mobilis TaxID=1808979 RepID=A0A5Q0BIM3_9GAMM|nr:hypothetical protein [Candidatus Methylospira mobilis]QFY42962.1 hypothetical protein F6R98_10340 [Candidatus Methylospira mobilis]
MSIPQMNEKGLLPVGVHSCTLDEAESVLCWNDHRASLWCKLGDVLNEFRAQSFPRAPLFVDGSYVTDKPIPSDVELLIDLRSADDLIAGKVVLYCQRNHLRLRTDMLVDFYPVLQGGNDFASFFQYVGEKTACTKGLEAKDKKGILRIDSW